jgi:cytochrome c peroxidase
MKTRITILLLIVLPGLASFSGGNRYFVITADDVVFRVPEGFPKPVYDFQNNPLRPEVFTLGRKLFYDPILSRDSTISCASCHQRLFAFGHVDHRLSHGINGLIGTRNVPPLQNLAWSSSFMWDGGVNHLELQPVSPITNAREMDETLTHVLAKLRANGHYRADFRAAFTDTAITTEHLLKALAQFTGLMVSCNSRYDKYLRGADTFSVPEKQGLSLFREKCATCHTEPLFTNNGFRNNGLKPDTAFNDSGRARITGLEADMYAFRVPGLRNVALTYPYMHDGSMRNLHQVLDHYGDPQHFDAHASPEVRRIGVLNATDKDALYAFLLTLTDKDFIYDRRFVDPFIDTAR